MNAAARGDKAIAISDWSDAIEHYTHALIELPRAPGYYIKRSTAHSRLKPADGGPNSEAALRDAETALVLARERGKREQILDAQMRRAIALFQLERYEDAAYIFGIVKDKTGVAGSSKNIQDVITQGSSGDGATGRPKNSREQELSIWLMKVKGKLSKVGEGSDTVAVTVKEYPDISLPSEPELRKILASQLSRAPEPEAAVTDKTSDDRSIPGQEDAADKTNPSDIHAASLAPSAQPSHDSTVSGGKIRHEWYQSNDSVVLTLYAKGVPKDKVNVDLQDTSVSIEFPLPSNASYSFMLDPLFSQIDPNLSKASVMSTKIEVILRKLTPGHKWSALEASVAPETVAASPAAGDPATSVALPVAVSAYTVASDQTGPVYPTSSRHGAKDWDKLAIELTSKKKNKAKTSTGEAKEADVVEDKGAESDSAGSVDSDYGAGDPVDSFFKKLYANADPDTRRAMVKSYYESQGTALSTNWDEVSKGKVEARPPSD